MQAVQFMPEHHTLQVSGPVGASIAALKLLRGTVSYYHLVIQLPASFLGQATVSFVVYLCQRPYQDLQDIQHSQFASKMVWDWEGHNSEISVHNQDDSPCTWIAEGGNNSGAGWENGSCLLKSSVSLLLMQSLAMGKWLKSQLQSANVRINLRLVVQEYMAASFHIRCAGSCQGCRW